ncbi:hypothetical protein DFH06DRAFT_1149025 [Mycena polygramma]|nr:hypothetical protein DFH06DRAFT_1151232 [Mycena polygramma]KAJ7608291.1 hypothetical protein DFH06DRAFT_1149025 [Mycena polygramma]
MASAISAMAFLKGQSLPSQRCAGVALFASSNTFPDFKCNTIFPATDYIKFNLVFNYAGLGRVDLIERKIIEELSSPPQPPRLTTGIKCAAFPLVEASAEFDPRMNLATSQPRNSLDWHSFPLLKYYRLENAANQVYSPHCILARFWLTLGPG